MTYFETRKAVKTIIAAQGGNFYNANINWLVDAGHDFGNVQKAMSYFFYSPQQAKFRASFQMA